MVSTRRQVWFEWNTLLQGVRGMQPRSNEAPEARSRFRISPLEERIAPSAGCYTPCQPSHGDAMRVVSAEVEVQFSASVNLGGGACTS
jgi:hypothetical protein